MSFGGAKVPPDCVVRTIRVKVMTTSAKQRRAYGLLVSAGDVLAWSIDRFHARRRAGLSARKLPRADVARPEGARQLRRAHHARCAGRHEDLVGELLRVGETDKARERASLPLRKHHVVPVTWRKGEFSLIPSTAEFRSRVRLSAARGFPCLEMSLSHDHPYDPGSLRRVRLLEDTGDLYLDITAWVKVASAAVTPGTVAGIDPGIIHPVAMSIAEQALLVSGRATRAEEFLHLEDQKLRDRHLAPHRKPVRAYPGKPRQQGSRRWRKIAQHRRTAEAKSRRRVKLAANTAARHVAEFAVEQRVARVVIGDPRGIEQKHSGRVHNRRVARWLRAATRDAVRFRFEEHGIAVECVDERGTSSRCPFCDAPAIKSGRLLTCTNPVCRATQHRDLAVSQNIAKRNGGAVKPIAHIEHRRVGQPTRRDRRRRRYDASRGDAGTPAAAEAISAESLVAA